MIRGVWWNDDPNQLLNFPNHLTWATRMKIGERIARRRPGSIGGTYRMQHRSHYGDLQFLHAMANNDGETAADTQRRILEWMQFAYQIALNRISPQTRLGQIDLPVTRNAFRNQRGWTVDYLFAPVYRLDPVGDVALGSMLHAVQDSYAAGHAKRAFGSSPACPAGRVVQFHSFVKQDSDAHGVEDLRTALTRDMTERFTPGNNPVEASARLIAFVRRRADWETEVEPYLRNNLFCIDSDAELSGPGRFE
jgi:hypothetical protein